MRSLLCFIPFALMVAAPVAEITAQSSTQAVLRIRGHSGPCTLNLYEGTSAAGVLHPDVTASVDTSRADLITWDDGSRIVTLGHQRSNLALAADTRYYGTVTGCGTAASFRFTTAPPKMGATMPPAMPVDCAASADCLDYPQIDWTPAGRDKWYVDPMTGIKAKVIMRPEDFSRSSHDSDNVIPYWAGGAGWTNPANLTSGSTTVFASTAGTQPMYLYVNPLAPYGASFALENIGLVIWGAGTGATAASRTIDICFSRTADTCDGAGFAVVLPLVGSPPATVAKQTGSTFALAGGAFPPEYPRPLYAGWGNAIRRDEWPQGSSAMGTVTVASGVATIASPTQTSHFQRGLSAGDKIFITSSGCSGMGMTGMCSFASVTNAGSATLNESISVTGQTFAAFPVGIMVKKRNATSTVYVGMRYKFAGTGEVNTSTSAPDCSNVQVYDPDGVPGHLCFTGGGSYGIFFISTDGEIIRPIAVPFRPSSFGSQETGQSLAFSASAGNVMFATSISGTMYKLTYTGNYKDTVWNTDEGRYIIKPGGDAPISSNPAFCASSTQCELINWETAISPALNAQITTNWPAFNSAPFSSWAAGTQFGGLSGDLLFIYKTIGGQNEGPCHVAVVNIITRQVIDVFSTLDPATAQGWGAGCHSIAATSYPNSMAANQNIPQANNPARISAGPFDGLLLGVWRSGAESANTALPWPIDASYDSTCPADLPAEYQAMGAVSGSNQCVKIHMRKPCNIAPHAADTTLYGVCPYNAAWSLGPDLLPGNNFFDPQTDPFSAGSGDGDHFRPLPPITDNGDGTLTFWAQRNTARYYCCSATVPATNPAGANCGAQNSQMDHANGWKARMNAGTVGSCNETNTFYWYPNANLASRQIIDKSRAFAGHTFLGRAPGGKMFHLGGGTYNVVLDSPLEYGVYPVKANLKVTPPIFQTLSANIGVGAVQSYVNASQFAAADDKLIFAVDWNHLNNASGAGSNDLLNTLPGARTFTNVGTNVWRTQPTNGLGTNAVNYKLQPVIGWNGQYAMKDVSGPASDITAAEFNSFCYVRKAGECFAGSTVGQAYVKSEKLYATSLCNPALWWANTPCVFAMHPTSGWIRQMISTRHDTSGSEHRLLSSGWRVPGATTSYSSAKFYPNGDLLIISPGGWTQSHRSAPLLLKVPRWEDTTGRNNYAGGLTAKIGARTGMTHARVRFGYNTSFHCTSRNSECVTDNVLKTLTAPFAFDDGSDTLTNIACSAGCSIPVPATPGRLTYYRIETWNGTAWTLGNTRAVVP